jgi:hypothetical protein
MDRLCPAENAERVRTLELRRLDSIASELWPKAIEGDLPSIRTYLDVSQLRSRLMGLFPRDGQPVHIGIGVANKADDGIEITFVSPSRPREPVSMTPPSPYQDAKPDYDRPAIAAPPERWPRPHRRGFFVTDIDCVLRILRNTLCYLRSFVQKMVLVITGTWAVCRLQLSGKAR